MWESSRCSSETTADSSVCSVGYDPLPEEISAELGTRWDTELYAIKHYAAMAGLHAGIDAVLKLSAAKPIDPSNVATIDITVGSAAYGHGGFPIERPITNITAQMSLRYSPWGRGRGHCGGVSAGAFGGQAEHVYQSADVAAGGGGGPRRGYGRG